MSATDQAQMTETMGDIWSLGLADPRMPRDTINHQYMVYENTSNASAVTKYSLWNTDTTSYFLPSTAHLEVNFTVTKADGTTTVDLADQTALASNGWSLFEDAKLLINERELNQVQKPGKICHALNLVEKGRNHMDTIGEMSHYYVDEVSDLHDTATIAYTAPITGASTTAGTSPVSFYHDVQYVRAVVGGATGAAVTSAHKNPNFDRAFQRKIDRAVGGNQSVFLPLVDIFPILAVDRVIHSSKIQVDLNKISNVAEALFGATAGALINITKIRLWMARLEPSTAAKARALEQIAANPVVTHRYDNLSLYKLPYSNLSAGDQTYAINNKANRPSKVYCFFQFADRDTSVLLNGCQFDRLGVSGASLISRVELRVNGKQIPNTVYNPSTDAPGILHELYRMGYKGGEDSACLSMKNWASMFPMFGFDLSLIGEDSAYESRGQHNLDLYWTTTNTIGSNYNVYVVVVSEGSAIFDSSAGITTVRTF